LDFTKTNAANRKRARVDVEILMRRAHALIFCALSLISCRQILGLDDADLTYAKKDAGTNGGGGTGGASGGTGGGSGGAAGAASGGVSGGSAGSGGTAGSTASGGSAGAAGATGELVFSDPFDKGLGNWTPSGDGTWDADTAEARQSVPTATQALLYVTSLNEPKVRVLAKVRQIASNDPMSALELVSNYSSTDYYHCNWQPNDATILLKQYSGGTGAQKTVPKPTGYDPAAPVTIEMTATPSSLHCRVIEVPGAEIDSVPTTPLPAGSVGIKTWNSSGSFDDFTVYKF
jgi:hypothetical protein